MKLKSQKNHQIYTTKTQIITIKLHPVIDEIYTTGINAGAIGGKLLGAGGGGFMLFYAHPSKHENIKSALKDKLFVSFRFENTGSKIVYFSHE